MGALSPTTAKAIAGAASASKSTPTKEKSSGVSSASKSGGSAKDAGSPKQVTPKGPGTSSGKGAVSKVSSTASKVADASDIYGSASPSKPKTSVAKSSSAGKAASTKSVGSNTLLMGKDAANDPFSAANNFKAGLDAIGGMFSSPATAPLEGLTNRKVSTYAVDSNGYPIIPSASGTTFLDPGYTQLPDGTWVTEGNLEDYRPNGVGARGVGTAGAAVPNTWTADQVAYQGKQSFLPGATVNKTDGTSYVAAAPGFIAPDMGETRGEQRLSAEQLRALDLASQQRALDGISGIPFVGSAINGIASVADLLRGASPEKQYTEITIPGKGTAGINAASWANAADRVFAPRLPSDRERAAPAPFTPDDGAVVQTLEPNGQVSAPLTSLPASERWGWKSPYAGMATTILQALGNDPKMPDDMSIDLNMGDVPPPKGLDAAVEPRAFDTLVDNTGRILEHVGGLGIVKALAPDLWNGIGSAIKSIGTGKPNSMLDPTGNPSAGYWNQAEGTWTGSDGQVNQPRKGTFSDDHGTYTSPPPFPDLNHNGVDDRKEGYTGPDTRPPPGTTEPPPTTGGEIPLPVFDLPPVRTAQFPNMPPYDPGRSPEWTYFTNNHLADGGMVHAPGYAEGGEVDMSNPKVQLIGQTEDVLEKIKGGAKPDEQDAEILKAFVAQFGDAALKSLNDNVGEGLSMKSAGKGRQIKGPGGPKDDAVPAVIVEEGSVVSPAKLSNNEFVMPVEAVMGIGEGDVELGAERMQQLAERLSAGKGGA